MSFTSFYPRRGDVELTFCPPAPGNLPVSVAYVKESPRLLPSFPPSAQPWKNIPNVRIELTWLQSGPHMGPQFIKMDTISGDCDFLEFALTLEPFPFFTIFAGSRLLIKSVAV